VGGQPGEVVDGLHEIGLALAVASQEGAGPRLEGEIDLAVGTEVEQLEARDVHGAR